MIWDGIGSAQFIKAVADIAKGGGELQQLNPQPVWHQDLPVPVPESLPKGLPPPSKDNTPGTETGTGTGTGIFSPSIFELSSSLITKLKTHVSHKLNQSCSSFEVVTAKIWQSRARAMHADHPNVNLHLHIAMNVRHILKQVIPPGYYGNCFHLATLSMERCRLVSEELHEVVKMIKDAKERLPVDYFEWLKGNVKVDPGSFGSSYESLGVTDWTRLGYWEADFGWGCPKNLFPVLRQDQKFASCLVLRGPAGQDGLRLVAQCLGKEELGLFYDELVSLN